MTANPQSPPPSDELEDWLMEVFASNKLEIVTKAKAAINVYILAEVLKVKPEKRTDIEGHHPGHTPEQLTRITVMNRSYNQGIDDYAQALIARFGGTS